MKALVVGATGAVGSTIVKRLKEKGIEVFCTATSYSCKQNDGHLIKWQAHQDFMPPPQLESTSQPLLVFYCIGIPSSKSRIANTTTDEFKLLFDINAVGLVRIYNGLRILKRTRLSIVAISSDATISPRSKNGPYTASKLALEAIARTIAMEDGEDGVRINVLAPSLIDSPMAREITHVQKGENYETALTKLPNGRAISPDEVAQSAIDIASSVSWSYANGQLFRLGAPPR